MCHTIGSLDLRPPCSAHHHHHHHQQLRRCQNQCTVKLSIALTWTSSLRMKTPWWVKYTHSHTTVWCVFLFYVSQCSIFLFFFVYIKQTRGGSVPRSGLRFQSNCFSSRQSRGEADVRPLFLWFKENGKIYCTENQGENDWEMIYDNWFFCYTGNHCDVEMAGKDIK